MLSPSATGVLWALAASALWALANVYIQRTGRALGSLRAMLWAQIVGGALLIPIALLLDGFPLRLPLVALTLTGAASALGYYGMMRAFRIGPLSVVTPIVATWPLFGVALGVLLRDERPSLVTLAGGGLVVLGSSMNGWLASRDDDGPRGKESVQAALWGLAGSVGFGGMTVGVAELGPSVGVVAVVPLTWLAQWLLLTPLLVMDRGLLRPPERWRDVVGMATCEAGGFLAYSVAASVAPVSVVGPPASLSTLCTVAFAALMLGERIGPLRWAFVLLGVAGSWAVAG